MSRPCVYLVHFKIKLHRAQHYLGYASSLDERIECHRSGQGSPLLRAVSAAGIEWEVVRTWPDGTRTLERQLKNRKKARELCPRCREEKDATATLPDDPGPGRNLLPPPAD